MTLLQPFCKVKYILFILCSTSVMSKINLGFTENKVHGKITLYYSITIKNESAS